jgi:iron complex transport system substrate-binding protein
LVKVEHIGIAVLVLLVVAVSSVALVEIRNVAGNSTMVIGEVNGNGSDVPGLHGTGNLSPNSGLNNSETKPVTRTITDMNGRTVTIPSKITKVYSIGSCPSYDYMLAPEKLVGWSASPRAPSNTSLKYIAKEYRNLPVIGSSNYEAIIAAHPDIVILENNNSVEIEKVQEKLGSIPVVSVPNWHYASVGIFEKNLRFLGDVLGVPEKADTEITYIRTVLNEIKISISTIPESERVRVFYSGDTAGLKPPHWGLPHTEWINICGGINVFSGNSTWQSTSYTVTRESVLIWKPDVIVTTNPVYYSQVYDDGFWKRIPAVQTRRVYLIPTEPFNWFDSPHGINTIVGLPWTAHAFYPERFSEEWARSREKEFFATFYHIDLSDEQLSSLLNGREG